MEGFTKLGAGVAPTRSAPAVVDLAGLVDVVQVRVDVPALFVRRPVVVKNALAAGRPCPTEVLPPRHIAGGGPPITQWKVQPGVRRLPPAMAAVTLPVPGDGGVAVAWHWLRSRPPLASVSRQNCSNMVGEGLCHSGNAPTVQAFLAAHSPGSVVAVDDAYTRTNSSLTTELGQVRRPAHSQRPTSSECRRSRRLWQERHADLRTHFWGAPGRLRACPKTSDAGF